MQCQLRWHFSKLTKFTSYNLSQWWKMTIWVVSIVPYHTWTSHLCDRMSTGLLTVFGVLFYFHFRWRSFHFYCVSQKRTHSSIPVFVVINFIHENSVDIETDKKTKTFFAFSSTKSLDVMCTIQFAQNFASHQLLNDEVETLERSSGW